MNIPCTGVSDSKARFFREVGNAFELLALFYSLLPAEQEEWMSLTRRLEGAAAARTLRKG